MLNLCVWVCALLVFCSSFVELRAAEWQWQFSETHSLRESALAVCLSSESSAYVVGTYRGAMGVGEFKIGNAEKFNSYLAHFDRDGRPQWLRRIAGLESNSVYDVCADADGNAILIGRIDESASFGNVTLASPNEKALAFIAKYSASGELLWARALHDNSQNAGAYHLAVDGEGMLYTASFFFDSCRVGNTLVYGREASASILIGKFTADGEMLWHRVVGPEVDPQTPAGAPFANDIVVDAEANCTLVGNFNGRILFGDTAVETASRTNHAYAISFDKDGRQRWHWQIPVTRNDFAVLNSVDADAAGNLYMLGRFRGSVTIGDSSLSSSGASDLFVLKTDQDGRRLHLLGDSGEGAEDGRDIACTDAGDFLISGTYNGPAQIAQSPFRDFARSSAFMAFFDSRGTLQWTGHADAHLSTRSAFAINGIDISNAGVIMAAGKIQGYLTIGGTRFERDTTSVLQDDLWLARLAADCPTSAADNAGATSTGLELAPQPAGPTLRIALASLEAGPVELKVFDMQGRMRLARHFSFHRGPAFSQQIPLEGLERGVYHLFISGSQSRIRRSFVVQH